MFGRYKVEFSYLQDGKRIHEWDVFWADNAQEAVDNCRSEYIRDFTDKFGRIEEVLYDGRECWEIKENWK